MTREPPEVLRTFGLLFPRGGSSPALVVSEDGVRPPSHDSGTVVVGDSGSTPDAEGWSGNAVTFSWDVPTREVVVRTSLAGFPPAFEIRTDGWWGVVSSLALLRDVEGLEVSLDPEAVLDVCRLGFPVDGRTLFRGVSLLPAGRTLRLREAATAEEGRWEPDPSLTFATFAEYADHQVGLFAGVMRRLDPDRSLFSLSGGLDTRAIFAGLARNAAIPDCYTVSGPRTSLDALLARELCKAYGVRHQTVVLAGSFFETLWDSARQASLLSGGVSSLWSAPQTYCYTQLSVPNPHDVVLSGFLGNQVGRGSTEGISTRPVDLSVLDPSLQERARASAGDPPWYRRGLRPDGNFDRRFLIQEENQFASMAGYSIGQAHAVQRSPYSDAGLLEAAVSMPPPPETGRSWVDPRITEMAKRFVGVGDLSFQAPYIRSVGGKVASHPINYGWTAGGTVSWRGWLLGARAFAEDVMTVAARRSRVASLLQRMSGLDGFSTHLYADTWIRHVRDPLMDALRSDAVRHAGVLDPDAAEKAVASFTEEGRSKLETVIAVADLALVTVNFGARRPAD